MNKIMLFKYFILLWNIHWKISLYMTLLKNESYDWKKSVKGLFFSVNNNTIDLRTNANVAIRKKNDVAEDAIYFRKIALIIIICLYIC